jgi:hypothetical protein
LVEIDHVKAIPLPPVTVNAIDPFGGVDGVAGVIAAPPPTETFTLAVLPSESVTFTMSTTPVVGPAVY